MATLLLIVIYIAFIGLGLPDSLFGAAWPAIYGEYNFPISFGSFTTIIVSCGTAVSSTFSAKLINRFGTKWVTFICTFMTALAILGISFTGNYWLFLLCAIPLGLGAGSIDTALNNYVAIHYSASQMSFLHCFYGIGVTVSPFILSKMISSDAGWRGGYRNAFFIQAGIAFVLLLALPLWKKAFTKSEEVETEEEPEAKVLTFKEMFAIPGVRQMCLLFLASVAIEATCGSWGATFLVENKGLQPELAARTIMFYYIGMALGRFVSGLAANKLHGWKIIHISEVVLAVALLILLFSPTTIIAAIGLFLIGFGNGPMFPNFNYLTPENFGEENSVAIIGVQMAFASISMMTMPVLCGLLGQFMGMWIFPVYLLLFFVLMVFETLRMHGIKKTD